MLNLIPPAPAAFYLRDSTAKPMKAFGPLLKTQTGAAHGLLSPTMIITKCADWAGIHGGKQPVIRRQERDVEPVKISHGVCNRCRKLMRQQYGDHPIKHP